MLKLKSKETHFQAKNSTINKKSLAVPLIKAVRNQKRLNFLAIINKEISKRRISQNTVTLYSLTFSEIITDK